MGLFSKLFGGRGDTAPQTIEAEPEPIKTEVNVDQLRRDANGMVAVYQGLLEANKNEGIEDRGQVAKIEKSHRLTSELADGLEAARGGDVNMIGDPAEIANNMLAEFDSTLEQRDRSTRRQGNGCRGSFQKVRVIRRVHREDHEAAG